jgi:hypothetical protein
MNKTDLLLQMMESPQDYTAAEWQEILADDECRELYTLMSKMQSVMDAARSEERATDEMIDAEWQQLKPVASNHSTGFYKIAAMIISVVMLSGIAYAAIYMVQQYQEPATESVSQSRTTHPVSHDAVSVPADTIVAPQPVLYDNVPLEQILADVSTYYHIKVVYRDDAARHYRLFYQWRPEYSIKVFVEMLNNFEALQLLLENDTLFVSSSEDPQS